MDVSRFVSSGVSDVSIGQTARRGELFRLVSCSPLSSCLPLNNTPIGGTAVLLRSLLCSSSTMSGMQSVLTNAQLKASPLKDPMLHSM